MFFVSVYRRGIFLSTFAYSDTDIKPCDWQTFKQCASLSTVDGSSSKQLCGQEVF